MAEFIDALKSFLGPCRDCGANHHLTFDHVRGVKKFNICDARDKAWATLIEEVQKCEIVCFWCHERREVERGVAKLRWEWREDRLK